MLQNLKNLPCRYRGQKKLWIDSDLFEDWVREQDNKFEGQNRKVLLIVDNCPAHPEIGGLKATELCFLPSNTTSITQPMDQGVIRSLKAKYRSRMIQRIIKAVDANKQIYSKSEYIRCHENAYYICWENVTEQTVKKCFVKSRISIKDQINAQNDLDDPFTELRISMEKLKSLDVEVPEELTPEEFANFDHTVASTEPILSDESILEMVREVEEPVEVESDEEDGDDKIEINDKCLEKPPPIDLRSSLESLMDFIFFMESEEVERYMMKISAFAENELSKNLNQASNKDYFG